MMDSATAGNHFTPQQFKPLVELLIYSTHYLGTGIAYFLDQAMTDALSERFNGENGNADWDDLANPAGTHSCDMVLDTDDDGLANFEEEQFGTNPTSRDSDMDMIDDIVEVSNTSVSLFAGTGEDCNVPLSRINYRAAPFMAMERSWFLHRHGSMMDQRSSDGTLMAMECLMVSNFATPM